MLVVNFFRFPLFWVPTNFLVSCCLRISPRLKPGLNLASLELHFGWSGDLKRPEKVSVLGPRSGREKSRVFLPPLSFARSLCYISAFVNSQLHFLACTLILMLFVVDLSNVPSFGENDHWKNGKATDVVVPCLLQYLFNVLTELISKVLSLF